MTAAILLAAAIAIAGYTAAGYPLALLVLGRWRPRPHPKATSPGRPSICILIPAHNAGASLERTLQSVLSLECPARRRILVVSDASTDSTDAIARAAASRGVELLRLPTRRGKTAAENLAARSMDADIVVTVDAAVELPPQSLTHLLDAFADPSVGMASGRDVSVATRGRSRWHGETGYVGYEMWLRALESRVDGIVGASGCFYAARADLYAIPIPEHLSRDFAAALVARDAGYRSVSVPGAICLVPRTDRLDAEYRRKARTAARGIATLWRWRHLLDPRRDLMFAWMLWSHKVLRWCMPATVAAAAVALALLAASSPVAAFALAVGILALLAGAVTARRLWRRPGRRGGPLAWLAYGVMSQVAIVHAWWDVTRGRVAAMWNPTVR